MGNEVLQFSNQMPAANYSQNQTCIQSYAALPQLVLRETDVFYCSWRKLHRESANYLLDLSMNQRINNIFFLSTSAVYGECRTTVSEDDSVRPKSEYANEKIEVEEFLFKEFASSATILRLGSIFGGKNLSGFVDALAIHFLIERYRPFSLNTELNCTRNFISLNHLVKILHELCQEGILENLKMEILNIGSDKSLTLNTVIRMGENQFGRDIVIRKIPMAPTQILINNFFSRCCCCSCCCCRSCKVNLGTLLS
jgi:nucleoside-diphosphate-sugar epimerase